MHPPFCGASMIDYRVFEIDREGHVFSPAHIIQCEDDAEAVAHAFGLAADHAVEIWAGLAETEAQIERINECFALLCTSARAKPRKA
jgi:hypothetical protein